MSERANIDRSLPLGSRSCPPLSAHFVCLVTVEQDVYEVWHAMNATERTFSRAT